LIESIPAPSPNFDARTAPPDMVVLHYTGMRTGEEALARLRDAEAKVSAHYLIEEDGRVFSLVAEERRAWHAGVSFWKGERNINAVSIPTSRRRASRIRASCSPGPGWPPPGTACGPSRPPRRARLWPSATRGPASSPCRPD
jgi:hypothetical protein